MVDAVAAVVLKVARAASGALTLEAVVDAVASALVWLVTAVSCSVLRVDRLVFAVFKLVSAVAAAVVTAVTTRSYAVFSASALFLMTN